ncbi:helix-turn-helix domain-containing protein [Marinimicrobium sp. ABcell2]|uniref:helix-turn-helix domain-containing protein n=1 Tax=Marinimicrobium sp. ABcell2 TaxID=3069751 RepID=UPI0027B5ED11|nr:helix-turn-helix domain-containing protein [Marinimicrobium sp. ABcell2]MDQ2075302.1 helix-turn-helix domain-containing protein [Marinimicrobium sp. ABcell2]
MDSLLASFPSDTNPGCAPYATSDLGRSKPRPDSDTLSQLFRNEIVCEAGERIFAQGTPFNACYLVRSGAFKSLVLNERGDEKIISFHMPGDLIGLDSIHRGYYIGSAVALERSLVYEVVFQENGSQLRMPPDIQEHFVKIMSRELANIEDLLMLTSEHTAEERIIAFLLAFSTRQTNRNLTAHQFRLPMSRNDIASFLGLAVETVSRMLTRLHEKNLLKVTGRNVEFIDIEGLRHRLKTA